MDDEMIQKRARNEGVPIGTIEKDYAVTGILFLISQFPKIDRMVFKGGTTLKKAYFDDFGFSEDIDFTCLEGVSEDLHSLLESKKDQLDFAVRGITKRAGAGASRKMTVRYSGFRNHPRGWQRGL